MSNVIVTVSVDWEGRHIRDENLDAMYHFRQEFAVPLTHFICPAYFTRGAGGHVDPCVAGRIRSQILPSDEVGLHVHCWESLVMDAGVPPLSSPNAFNYCGPGGDPEYLWVPYGENALDTGQGVALGAFAPGDVVTLVQNSQAILTTNGLGGSIQGFRAGGWMGSDTVLASLPAAGFVYDSSATDARVFAGLAQESPETPLYTWVAKIWGQDLQTAPYLANSYSLTQEPLGVGHSTQPYTLAIAGSTLIEMPDNGVLADYVDVDHMLAVIQAAMARRSVKPVFVHIGFHQESAQISYDTLHRKTVGETYNLAKVVAVLRELKRTRAWDQLEFLTAAAAAQRFTAS